MQPGEREIAKLLGACIYCTVAIGDCEECVADDNPTIGLCLRITSSDQALVLFRTFRRDEAGAEDTVF